jgi:hypothetical protein
MLQINKGNNIILIGDYENNNPETILRLSGGEIRIKSTINKILMTFENILFNFEYNHTEMNICTGTNNVIIEHGYQLRFDENRDFLIQRPKRDNEVVN